MVKNKPEAANHTGWRQPEYKPLSMTKKKSADVAKARNVRHSINGMPSTGASTSNRFSARVPLQSMKSTTNNVVRSKISSNQEDIKKG